MKLSKKLLAVAVLAAVASGAAEARIQAPGDVTPSGSELLFNLVNYTTEKSYTLDLGVTIADFLANPTQVLPSLVFDFSVNNANFQQFLSFYTPGNNVKWGVSGGHTVFNDLPDQATYGFYTTSVDAVPAVIDENFGDISNTIGVLNEIIGFVQTNDSIAVNNSTFKAKGQNGYTGGYGNDFLGALPFTAMGDVGQSLYFVHEGVDDVSYFDGALTTYANKWTFDISGNSASLTYAPVASAVPLPAAVWMFGAGLMGVLRLNRRQSKAI